MSARFPLHSLGVVLSPGLGRAMLYWLPPSMIRVCHPAKSTAPPFRDVDEAKCHDFRCPFFLSQRARRFRAFVSHAVKFSFRHQLPAVLRCWVVHD